MLTTLSSKKERLTRAGSETTRTSPRIVPTCGRENILIKAAVYDSQGYPRLMRRTESRRCHGGEGTRFNNVRGRGNPELQILCRLLLCSSAFPARQDQAYRTDHYVRTSFFSSLTDPAERPGDSDSLSCWARHQERRRQALPRWLVQVDPPTSKLSLPHLHCDDEPVSLLDESMGGGPGGPRAASCSEQPAGKEEGLLCGRSTFCLHGLRSMVSLGSICVQTRANQSFGNQSRIHPFFFRGAIQEFSRQRGRWSIRCYCLLIMEG